MVIKGLKECQKELVMRLKLISLNFETVTSHDDDEDNYGVEGIL